MSFESDQHHVLTKLKDTAVTAVHYVSVSMHSQGVPRPEHRAAPHEFLSGHTPAQHKFSEVRGARHLYDVVSLMQTPRAPVVIVYIVACIFALLMLGFSLWWSSKMRKANSMSDSANILSSDSAPSSSRSRFDPSLRLTSKKSKQLMKSGFTRSTGGGLGISATPHLDSGDTDYSMPGDNITRLGTLCTTFRTEDTAADEVGKLAVSSTAPPRATGQKDSSERTGWSNKGSTRRERHMK
eukprot:GEMP01048957.1.p1 GENE.GEMP01048957.1~~GEMP01048957.1.p1  ORF type:complete len:239 (+),score=60.39 GEMP01048957.1:376-1092(+)